jgi:hypothetical protein
MAPVIFLTANAPPMLPLVISYRIRDAAMIRDIHEKISFFIQPKKMFHQLLQIRVDFYHFSIFTLCCCARKNVFRVGDEEKYFSAFFSRHSRHEILPSQCFYLKMANFVSLAEKFPSGFLGMIKTVNKGIWRY